jgi:DNA-binding MarR family transcriptional regulator
LEPSDINQSIGYLTGRSHRLIRDAVSAELVAQGYEISSTFMPVLGYMALNHPKPIVQRDLADMLDFDRHRVSRIVKEIEGKGWIRSQTNPKSKRENLIELTKEGFSIFKVIGQCASEVFERAFEGCSREEREITEKTLKIIINNLSAS